MGLFRSDVILRDAQEFDGDLLGRKKGKFFFYREPFHKIRKTFFQRQGWIGFPENPSNKIKGPFLF
ncbi:hypothetical protein C5O22_03155 [Treponema sp. J25]|nr:hypothetical protein C5O22_03155 [Treponema sp. J25]